MTLIELFLLKDPVLLFNSVCKPPLSTEFSKQAYWSGLPFSIPGDIPDPGIVPTSPALAIRFFTTKPPGQPLDSPCM